MNRRHVFLGLLGIFALCGASRPGRAECGGQSITEFVETLYQKQARLQVANAPLTDEEINATFSRGLRRLMRTPHRSRKATHDDGPILNAFFGWGVLPKTEIKIGKVEIASGDELGPATISVAVEYHGEPHKMLVRVVSQRDDWRIADITYDIGKSLAEHYRGLAGR